MSGGSSLRPLGRLAGGCALPPVASLRAFSSRRMPEGCCRLARQLELMEAGWRCSRSLCWRLMSWTHMPASKRLHRSVTFLSNKPREAVNTKNYYAVTGVFTVFYSFFDGFRPIRIKDHNFLFYKRLLHTKNVAMGHQNIRTITPYT